MSPKSWQRPLTPANGGREATRAAVVEAIDRTAPETKAALAKQIDISEQYLSEILRSLKADGIVRKAYTVDDGALYDNAATISPLDNAGATEGNSGHEVDGSVFDRGTAVIELLERLESVTTRQFRAAQAAFLGEPIDTPATTLESLTNERWSAVVSELKSATLTTEWPGNRVAADLSTIATDLELVGDRACFVADMVDRNGANPSGIVADRLADVFESGRRINEHFTAILFDCELTAHERLRAEEESVHRRLDELFELVTADDHEIYGYLVSITRALERAIYYWVDAAELAVQLHAGIAPGHLEP
ncbi:PhoU family transcriptional regulator [Halorhabdus amylolytica]|uniref:PhoU family transcriptional regulator n=1 Tax=Halorhabdus amylolytica TaxID=2559573 RepID=UPI0010AB2FF5|nr:PhoU family transcriptional regulator [Halorhabdus amylolytica]